MHVIIPARYASTRLPGKPLLDIAGKPMIQHVYERACESGASSVTVATDDARIRAACEKFGAKVVMTSVTHRSGTERLVEAIRQLGLSPDQIVVNVQGDEPLMPPAVIRRTAETLAAHAGAVVATVCCPIRDDAEFRNPNVVKVVSDVRGYALYFSRAPIPYPRDGGRSPAAHRHIGLYAYRAGYVAQYVRLAPSPYEQAEQLEQLRVLWHGGRIAVHVTDQAPPAGVDSPEDLERVRKYFNRQD
ncbi:MAG: 3-deoxy-manno-octulosonate cytidylyltransferase [Gammaproteobacteria bacterium]|nr:3-deoxy-manno-octulosonate cytidylyltransferase [Gammaproteobacteria bacterium]